MIINFAFWNSLKVNINSGYGKITVPLQPEINRLVVDSQWLIAKSFEQLAQTS